VFFAPSSLILTVVCTPCLFCCICHNKKSFLSMLVYVCL
jgi:hypothetical protein